MSINSERLADIFTTLCEIDSPSKKEGKLAEYLTKLFTSLGATVTEDDSAEITGSECGNLHIAFPNGGLDLEPVFFNCHLDTVEPGNGVKVLRQGDSFYSAGETILGADDKSGIAAIIEALRDLMENKIPYGPVECVFTTCEEVGLRGAKAFDPSRLRAKMGYALDTTDTNRVIIGAPAANRFHVEITGISAHAGLNPEQGINAIQLASRAVAELHLGRLDHESTANVGIISGGCATNIIPDRAVIHGEVRSHSLEKLAAFTEEIRETFYQVVDDWTDSGGKVAGSPSISFSTTSEYPAMHLDINAPVIRRVAKATAKDEPGLHFTIAGGGSDANIFTSKGVDCAIIGTGMEKVHTVDETITLSAMTRCAHLIQKILTTG